MSVTLPQGRNRSYWLLMFLFFGLLVIFMPKESHSDDWYWLHWARYCFTVDLGTIYSYQIDGHVPTNYHPIFLHCLDFFSQCFSTVKELEDQLYKIKYLPLFFDFVGAISIFLLVKKGDDRWLLPFFLLFNIAYLYNSMIWGQIDSVFTTLSLLAIILAIRRQPGLAIIAYLLAINTKLQAIIFLPLLLLLLLPSIFRKWRRSLLGIALSVGIQIFLLWPFIQAGQLSVMVETLTSGSVDLYARTSINAYNFWIFFFTHNSVVVADTELYYGLTYKVWGLLLFCLTSAVVLLPLSFRCLRAWWEASDFDERSKELIFLSATLIPLAFFFFNTQMHERYSHPALIMAFFYGYYRKNYTLYFLLSLAYLFNLEKIYKAFDLSYNTLIFDRVFIASLFALALLLGLRSIYRRHSLLADFKYFRFLFTKNKST